MTGDQTTQAAGLREQIAAAVGGHHWSRLPDEHGERVEGCSCGWRRYCGASTVPAEVRFAEHMADAVLSVVAGQVDALADVLAEHRPYLDITLRGEDDLTCYNPATLKFCGWQHVSDDGAECAREHAKHQAALVVARMVGGER